MFKVFYFLVLGTNLDQNLDPFLVHGFGQKIDLVQDQVLLLYEGGKSMQLLFQKQLKNDHSFQNIKIDMRKITLYCTM
jgi:hypothetical protein